MYEVVAGWTLQKRLDRFTDSEADQQAKQKFWDSILSIPKYCVFARATNLHNPNFLSELQKNKNPKWNQRAWLLLSKILHDACKRRQAIEKIGWTLAQIRDHPGAPMVSKIRIFAKVAI